MNYSIPFSEIAVVSRATHLASMKCHLYFIVCWSVRSQRRSVTAASQRLGEIETGPGSRGSGLELIGLRRGMFVLGEIEWLMLLFGGSFQRESLRVEVGSWLRLVWWGFAFLELYLHLLAWDFYDRDLLLEQFFRHFLEPAGWMLVWNGFAGRSSLEEDGVPGGWLHGIRTITKIGYYLSDERA